MDLPEISTIPEQPITPRSEHSEAPQPNPSYLRIKYSLNKSDTSMAAYSSCERYRYGLFRTFNGDLITNPLGIRNLSRKLVALMLNPSTATEEKNDPTVARIEHRARAMGYGGFVVLNLFALRSTDPRGLLSVEDPVGPMNDRLIQEVVYDKGCAMVLCAWGSHAALGDLVPNRAKAVMGLVGWHADKFYALKINKDGNPKHPLYCRHDLEPQPWRPGANR